MRVTIVNLIAAILIISGLTGLAVHFYIILMGR
jgi:phage shock protein PspC (stress-responsive transcriptional regulator)